MKELLEALTKLDTLTEEAAYVDKKGHPLAVGDAVSLGGIQIDIIEEIIMVPAIVTTLRGVTSITICKDVKLVAQQPTEEELLQLRRDSLNGNTPSFSPTKPEHFRGGLERDSYGKRHGL
jgi:hypothetical protein